MFLVCGESLFDVFVEDSSNPASFALNAVAGGSPFNVAIGLARLQQPVAFLGGVSRDELGRRLTSMLETESVNTDYLVRSERNTTLVMVSLDENGHPNYRFYGDGSADCGVTSEELPTLAEEITGVHFGSYSLVVPTVADAFASLSRKLGKRFVSLDPNIRPTIEPDMNIWRKKFLDYCSIAHLVKISSEDIDYLYPGRNHQDLAEELCQFGVRLFVVTDGGAEVRCWTSNQQTLSMQPVKSQVVDTVGAGDTFQAALLARIYQLGNPIEVLSNITEDLLHDLLNYASTAAAITCSRQGADLPRLEEVNANLG